MIRVFLKSSLLNSRHSPQVCRLFLSSTCALRNDLRDPEGITEPFIPPYQEKTDEPIELKRARLLYQSRKRGMLENGLLLSTFAAKYLAKMDSESLRSYDRLINLPSNDWDIYYWATGVKPTPPDFDTPIMDLLKKHIRNDQREARITQPALY